ncbi:ComEC/Rec2 family competence protein [Allonocardiopsis opalescens]|uniref:Competence protein ComEC n=1 Tax=Allonocardiopsis opalescens TaxID=1144618 RepID=A0A2T0QFJ5_9ACTN|nr:ComEC/Rec2 family competence protein [Allonocardiopsis opalescens]PRY02675.1 competence protein ComEC [Allonocardiopsis opalescens]
MNPELLDEPDDPMAPPDLRLVPPAAGVWGTALVLLGAAPVVAAAVGATALAGCLAALVAHRRGAGAWALVLAATLVCVAAASVAVGTRMAAVQGGAVYRLAGEEAHATVEVTLGSDPHERRGGAVPDGYVLEGRTEAVTVAGARTVDRVPVVLVAAGPGWQDLLPSQRVTVRARLVRSEQDGLVAALLLVRGPPQEPSPPSAAHRAAGAVRAALREACEVLPPAEAGLLAALVVGDTSRLDADVAEDLRLSGLAHLTAVSGANLAILLGALLGAARLLRLGTVASCVLGGVGIAAFVLVARAEPSVLRAAVMGGVTLLALVLGRQRAGLAALAAAVVLLVLFDPGLARSYGFALSVVATGGILVWAPRWRDRLGHRLPRWAAEGLAVPLAAQVAVAPLLVVLAAEVSLVSVPANVLVAPAVVPATVIGAAAAALGPVWPLGAELAVRPAGLAVAWIVAVARLGAALPGGSLGWPGGWAGAALLAAALLLLLVLWGSPRRLLAAGLTAVLVLAGARCAVPGWPPQGWLLVACDVGQGDAVVLSAGPGAAVVVDAGPDPRAVDGCLRRLGVRTVPLLVVTHGDHDHAGGVSGVARHRELHQVVVGGPPERPPPASVAALGTAVRTVEAGDTLAAGPVHADVLWPAPGFTGPDNAGSVVLRVRRTPPGEPAAEVTFLLTGDIEEDVQARLLAGGVEPVHVLKVPHHGAAGQDPGFLRAASAQVAVTSVGAGNTYGHPVPAVLDVLSGAGAANYRTDLHGDIAVSATPDGLRITTRGPSRPP